MRSLRRLGRLLRETVQALRGHDIALHAAAVTFYAGIALVPSVLIAVWLAAHLVGDERIREFGRSVASALPDELGAPHIVEATIAAGLRLPVAVAVAVVLPATFYGEGFNAGSRSIERALWWRRRTGHKSPPRPTSNRRLMLLVGSQQIHAAER